MSVRKYQNNIRRMIVFLTLAVFITTNVGMAVYTHTCSIAGTEKSLFLSYEDPCGSDHSGEKSACCSKNANEEEHVENTCCSTNTDYVALDIDTRVDKTDVQLIVTVFPLDPETDSGFYFSPDFVESAQQKPEYSDLPPPKYQGRDLQSINQVYLI